MSNTHASSRVATAVRTDHSHRTLLFALAAGLTIATAGFGLALVGGAKADATPPVRLAAAGLAQIEPVS